MRKEFRRIAGCGVSGGKASGSNKFKERLRATSAHDAEGAAREGHVALLSALTDDLLLPHVPSDARLMPAPTTEPGREKYRASV
jgi:hypothetical protein